MGRCTTMNRILLLATIAVAPASQAFAQLPGPPAAPPASVTRVPVTSYMAPGLAGQERPGTFVPHAQQDLGDGTACVVGAEPVRGEPNRKAAVYRIATATGRVIWNQALKVGSDWFGARATHCAMANGSLYILAQGDDVSSYYPLRTHLTVGRLDARTGAIQAGRYLAPPEQQLPDMASSEWVEAGRGNFRVDGGLLVLSGRYVVAPQPRGTYTDLSQSPQRPLVMRLNLDDLSSPRP